jgi:hypothetical protein
LFNNESFFYSNIFSLGSTGLLTLAWYLQRQSKAYEENEEKFHTYLEKTKKLIQEQYEKHVKDPNAQPWLVINQIRDKLIPENDQLVFFVFFSYLIYN